jgi:hypothetical protein
MVTCNAERPVFARCTTASGTIVHFGGYTLIRYGTGRHIRYARHVGILLTPLYTRWVQKRLAEHKGNIRDQKQIRLEGVSRHRGMPSVLSTLYPHLSRLSTAHHARLLVINAACRVVSDVASVKGLRGPYTAAPLRRRYLALSPRSPSPCPPPALAPSPPARAALRSSAGGCSAQWPGS